MGCLKKHKIRQVVHHSGFNEGGVQSTVHLQLILGYQFTKREPLHQDGNLEATFNKNNGKSGISRSRGGMAFGTPPKGCLTQGGVPIFE